ncbi:MAG: metallophosphoesterase [Selenomonadaceae bacterium]
MNKPFRRLLAISDIHGQKKQLLNVLAKAAYDPNKDQLIICGDSIDRGNDSFAAFEICQSLQKKSAIYLKGNHESMMELSLRDMIENPGWQKEPGRNITIWSTCNGGKNTIETLAQLSTTKLIQLFFYMRNMACYFTTDSYIFSHAGLNPSKSLDEQTENDLIWGTRHFYEAPAYKNHTVIYGHTPTFYLPGTDKNIAKASIWHDTIHKDKIDIDCGCVFGGRLACLELPLLKEYYSD